MTDPQPAPVSKQLLWAGRIVSALPALLLLASAIAKFLQPAGFLDGWRKFGYPDSLVVPIGIVELACTVLYVIPRTSVLGAILLTGYLGGATTTHVRIGDPFIPPILVGVFLWLGLYLRDTRLHALVPLRS